MKTEEEITGSMGVQSLPKHVEGYERHARNALTLLQTKKSKLGRHEAQRLLDASIGLSPQVRGWRGGTLSTYAGLQCLPVDIVRRVEYENVGRTLNMSEMQIATFHTLFRDDWDAGHVADAGKCAEYLTRATLCGNRFANKVLTWLAPECAQGIDTTLSAGRAAYLEAIRMKRRARAVGLGRMMCGAEMGMGQARPDATAILEMDVRGQKAVAANNIGYVLVHGAEGIERDAVEAIKYYSMAMKWGSAAAACNLGHLFYVGADGVAACGTRAKGLYEMALRRGERNYAPRNLAILYHRGADGVKADVGKAARLLVLGIREGEGAARAKCRTSLKMVMRSWRFVFVSAEVKRACAQAVSTKPGEGEWAEWGEWEMVQMQAREQKDALDACGGV